MSKDYDSINEPGGRECCGCGICILVCPEGCIELTLNNDGYYIASADTTKCINCGMCSDICYKYIDSLIDNFSVAMEIYGAYHKEYDVRYPSSSGGVATAICTTAINQGYKIIGAHLDLRDKYLKHIIIDNPNDLYLIRGSKYIPSYTVDAFAKLKEGGKYLVIGTPCQIGGLRRILPSLPNPEDVILIDFRCAGHPGYNLFLKYLDYLSSLNPSGIKTLNMRDKKTSWRLWGARAEFNDGTEYYKNKFRDLFCIAFRTGQAIHNTCLSCNIYKNQSSADLRMEDAWFFDVKPGDEAFQQGLSQVTIYSDKGAWLFEQASKDLSFKTVEIDLLQRGWVKAVNDGVLMELLRHERDLPAIIRQYKKTWGIRRTMEWRFAEFKSSVFGHKLLALIPRSVKKIIKLFT
jgi:coenzyme F420-reducing hydrogenase beta subunit